MRLLSILSFIIACYNFSYTQSDIQGPDTVCEDACETYSLNTTQELYWTITGGIVQTNTGSSIEICWEEAQLGEISVISLDQSISESMAVTINEMPEPKMIFPPFPNCNQDSLDNGQDEFIENEFCQKVCGGQNSSIEIFNINNSSNYTWIVTGDNNHLETTSGIIIDWPEEGYGSVLLIEENNSGCIDTAYVCIEILTKPSIAINLLNNQIDLNNVCQNQNLYSEAVSDQPLSYHWTTSDGQSYDGTNPNFSFSNSGSYQVNVIGTTNCICSVSETINIEVIDFVSPTIDCVGTICTNEEMTYYATDICGSYNWTVGPNGTITEGGSTSDNYISVIWSSGPYGTLSLATSACDNAAICSEPAIVFIPVMGTTVEIEGPDEVCNDEISIYRTQKYEGASYNWNIQNNGYIIEGNGTSEITVQWLPFTNSATISVDIENCFLGCASRGEKVISIEEPFFIYSNPSYCEGDDAYISSLVGYSFATSDWALITPDNQLITLDQNASDIQAALIYGPGIYEFVAEAVSDDYCNKIERSFIEVYPSPEPITAIDGPDFICRGEANEYSIINPSNDLDYQWTIEDGNSFFTFYGDAVFHQWITPGPYFIRVKAITIENNCDTDEFSKELFSSQNANLTGKQTSCNYDIETYTLEGVDANNIEWTLVPQLGTLVPQNDNTLIVQWHETGNADLIGMYCGETYTLAVEVINDVTDFNHDLSICEGETTDINFDPGTTVISVSDENGILVGNTNPTDVGPGFYSILTAGVNGCENLNSTYIHLDPNPAINLSSGNLNELCFPGGSATLDALSTNEVSSYTWYKDGVNLNMNSASITATEDGLYTVEIVNENGCTGSDALEVECRDSRCDCRPDGGVAYTYQRGLFCNEFDFTNASFDYIAGTLRYEFGDPNSPFNFTQDENPSHVFTEAGHFIVNLTGVVPHATIPGETCAARFTDFITVEAVSDFTNNPSCEGDMMEFFENANFLPGFTIANYEWSFGDPTSGASNFSTDANPTHQYDLAGNYDVTLTITTNTGCQSTITKSVIVHQLPMVDFQTPVSTCVDEAIEFTGISNGFNETWDFGNDPGRYINNRNAYHSYSVAGTYQVSFSAENIYGCITTITKTINVVDNPFAGEIDVNMAMPMCEGEEVTLTGPNGGFAYLWSNGETTASITTKLAGIYSVTVTSNDGCQYIPESVIVNTIRPINPIIIAYLFSENGGQETFRNEIEICEGENFSLGTSWFSNASYLWSTGETVRFIQGPNNLAVGEHIFTVSVTEPDYNCTIESDPLTVIVHPRPDNVQIESDQSGNCEGVEYTFSVINPQADLHYFWNDGQQGETIKVSTPGIYYVDAYNEFGCNNSSNVLRINPLPNIERMLTGCQESCFPDTLCVASSPFTTSYTWFLDGAPIPGADQDELIITQIGDYQVELTTAQGCSATSEILNISPKTTEQTLSGVVYIDENNNGIFDAGDEPITGAPINIISGGSVLATELTDVNGNYLFDPAVIAAGEVVLDTFGLGLNLSSSILSYPFEFTTCNEDLIINFNCNRVCETIEQFVSIYTCPGEMIQYEGVFYNEGDLETLTIIDNAGCQQTINLEVIPFELINYQLTTFPSCENQDDGILSITINSGDNLQFSLDGGSTYTSNPEFNNLPVGNHTLTVVDINGCMAFDNFNIPSFNSTPITFVTDSTCPGEDNGSIIIDHSASANMQFAIDDNSSYSSLTTINNLSAGDHMLYVLDEDGCASNYSFTIDVYAEPELSYEAYDSCSGHYLGALFVTTTDLSLEFSLNGIDYSDQTDYLDLADGDHILYVETADNCVFTYPFTINQLGLISIDIDTKNACQGSDNGEISFNNAQGLEISLDGLSYAPGDGFTDLAPGDYIFYAQDDNQCPISIPVTIEEVQSAELAFTDPVIDCSTKEVDLGVLNLNSADANYTWNNGETGSNIIIEESGLYEVMIETECETRTYEWDIQFERANIEDQPAFVPNIFTPDSQDFNSEFKPLLSEEITLLDYNFSIYDRWGNRMFSSDDNQEFWNGLYMNKTVEPGVFVWRIEMEYTKCDESSSFEKYGDVTLLR